MPKSKVRGGAKAHRKKVMQWSEKNMKIRKQREEMFKKMFSEKLEEMRQNMSGETNNVDLNKTLETVIN